VTTRPGDAGRCSGGGDVLQDLDHLVGGGGPGQRRAVDFLQRVDQRLIVQRDVRPAKRGAAAGIEGGVPLLVLVTEADNRQVATLDQGLGANGVDLGRLVISPERVRLLAEVIAGGIAGGMLGDRRGEYDIEVVGVRARLDFVAPGGMMMTPPACSLRGVCGCRDQRSPTGAQSIPRITRLSIVERVTVSLPQRPLWENGTDTHASQETAYALPTR